MHLLRRLYGLSYLAGNEGLNNEIFYMTEGLSQTLFTDRKET